MIGRAAGRDFDARRFPGYGPYGSLALSVPVLAAGDADARTRLRLAEIAESIRLLRALLDALPPGPVSIPLPADSGEGVGFAESARGDIWHWLRLDHGQIASVFVRDPGWAHWPLFEAIAPSARMADLPLIQASFLGRIARTLREGPAAEPPVPVDRETAASLAGRLEAAAQVRLGRSLAVSHIDAGSCGGCEIEVRALTNVIHDLERYGLTFVASPRHADLLLKY